VLSALLLSAFIQFGSVQGSPVIYEDPKPFVLTDFRAYADIGAKGEYGPVFVGGSVRTDMAMIDAGNWSPQQVTFIYEAGAKVGPLTAGVRRICYHPIMPYMSYYGYDVRPSSEGAALDVYLRLDIKGK
jgi:hypothetical protein